jgi:hypothetical protein
MRAASAFTGGHAQLVERFHPLCADRGAGRAREVHERADEGNLGRVGVDIGYERAIELDDVGPHAHHLLQTGIPLPGIVDRDPRAAGAQRIEMALKRVCVEHALLLGDLDDDPPQIGRQQLLDLRRSQGRGAQVDRQEAALRAFGRRERRPNSLRLERPAQPEAVGLREPPRRRQGRLALETGQRLEADRLAAGQGDDRLEDRVHGVGARDQLRELLALLLGHHEDVFGVVAAGSPPTRLLRPGKRSVGELEQRAGVAGILGKAGYPGRAVQRSAHRGRRLDGRSRGFGQSKCARALGVGHHQSEFVAADSSHHTDVAHGRAQARGRVVEKPVTKRVPARVVDALEVVYVEDGDGERTLVPPSPLKLRAQYLLEAAVVGQAGERIAVGQLLEAPVVLLEVGRHGIEVPRKVAQLVLAAPAEARGQVSSSNRLGGQAQPVEWTEDPASQHNSREDREAEEQDAEHERDALVAVTQQLVRRAQVVGHRQRADHATIVGKRGDERFCVTALVTQLGRNLLSGAHRLQGHLHLPAPPGGLTRRHERAGASRQIEGGRVDLGVLREKPAQLLAQLVRRLHRGGLVAALEGQ